MKIDQTYVINLDRRHDRWERIQDELRNVGLENFVRFSAIEAEVSAYPKKFRQNFTMPSKRDRHERYLIGQLGCKLSHVAVIQQAYDAGYENVLILEDDAVLSGSVGNLISIAGTMDWHLFYLGMRHKKPGEFVSDEIDRVTYGYQTHAYIVNRSIFRHILDNALPSGLEIDVFYANYVHQLGNSYVIKPHMAHQRVGDLSDIIKGGFKKSAPSAGLAEGQEQQTLPVQSPN